MTFIPQSVLCFQLIYFSICSTCLPSRPYHWCACNNEPCGKFNCKFFLLRWICLRVVICAVCPANQRRIPGSFECTHCPRQIVLKSQLLYKSIKQWKRFKFRLFWGMRDYISLNRFKPWTVANFSQNLLLRLVSISTTSGVLDMATWKDLASNSSYRVTGHHELFELVRRRQTHHALKWAWKSNNSS